MKRDHQGQLHVMRRIIFPLFFLSLFLFLLNFPLLALLGFAALIWLLLFREKSLVGLLLILSISVLFSQKLYQNHQLIQNNLAFFYENKRKVLEEVLKMNSGLDVLPSQYLPREVKDIKDLIANHQIPDFKLSGRLQEDPLIYQRTIEVNWPVKLESESNYLFYLADEEVMLDMNKSCQKIDQRGEVILVFCP